PSICPDLTKAFREVQDYYQKVPEVHLVSFTIDPKYDSSKVLKAFGDKYGANHARWHFLNGSYDSLARLMGEGYLLMQPKMNDEPAKVEHTEVLVLIDKDGHIRGNYNGTSKEDVDRLIDEIRVLQLSYDPTRR
ncbi:MAG: SCO family protein, partial [Bacteroidota bacterium]|nr:SCO family protein [Bacteroidota bacterium]